MGYERTWGKAGAFGVQLDRRGVIVSVTSSAAEVTGRSDLVGNTWASVCAEDADAPVSVVTTAGPMAVHVFHDSTPTGKFLWVVDAREEHTAKAKAERLQDDLNQLEYAISHDLTEPIRSISIGLGLYETEFMKGQPPEAVEMVHAAQMGAQQLNRFIQDFMAYLKVTEGKRRVSLRMVDLNKLVVDVMQSLRIIIQEADAEIVFQDLPVVMGEGRMLYQVFSNLLTNAMKFRDPNRKCRIEISCIPDGDQWRLQVKDNGLGIHQSKLSRIFTPFIRVHKHIPGSGIGLAVVKRCVELQGGTVQVESTVGVGTTFSVSLLRDRGPHASRP